MPLSPQELRAQVRGLISFPVTPFSAGGDVDLGGFREHVRYLIDTYSSAVFNFVPEIARAFYDAMSRGDNAQVARLLGGFYRPFADLRDQVKGYAVALIKTGVDVRGRPVGPVRPPLVNPSADHEAELREIITRGLSLLSREDTKEER